jgi:hypothetical protein
MPTYEELKLRIEPGGGGGYRVVASGPDGATATGGFALPFSATELDNFVLRVGRQRRGMRGYRSSQMEEAKRFGSELFEALMVDEVRDVFRSARGVADTNRKGLRVTLYLTDVPELTGVPWEFLYERPSFLAQSIYSPVVRSLDLARGRPPRPVTLPLHVLGMVSGPRGFDNLDVEQEKEKLANALAPLVNQQLVTLEWLERATLSRLDSAVSRRDEIHVLHYIGHGAYDTRTEGGILVLEDERGEPHEVSGEELGLLLQDEHSLRLAVLNSCEGARGSHVDPFSGAASGLVQYGIPGVIGMQFEITDAAAIAFSARLYTSLAEGYPVDAALSHARKAIFAAGNDIEFGTPVLFLCGGEARLFDLANPASPDALAGIEPPLPESPPPAPPAEERAERAAPSSPGISLRLGPPRSPRQLAILFAVLFLLGCVLAVIFDHGGSSNAGTGIAGLLIIFSTLGLAWAVVWALLRRRRNRGG